MEKNTRDILPQFSSLKIIILAYIRTHERTLLTYEKNVQ